MAEDWQQAGPYFQGRGISNLASVLDAYDAERAERKAKRRAESCPGRSGGHDWQDVDTHGTVKVCRVCKAQWPKPRIEPEELRRAFSGPMGWKNPEMTYMELTAWQAVADYVEQRYGR